MYGNCTFILVTGLRWLYGDSPRVRLLQALIEIAPFEFTASHAARVAGEAGRTSFYEACEELVRDGVLLKRKEGERTKYRVNEAIPLFEIVSVTDAALRRIWEDREGSHPETVEAFRERVVESVERTDAPVVAGDLGPLVKTEEKKVVFA